MKITFPHMGTISIPVKALFNELGFEVIVPPPITNKTIELGVKHSPEFACFPLKLNMGNFIEALEDGADTIVMGGGVGPCRFGYYSQVQKRILTDLGYNFEMIVLEPPHSYNEFLDKLKKLKNKNSWNTIYKALRITIAKIDAIDKIDIHTAEVRPYCQNKSDLDNTYEKILDRLDKASGIKDIERVTREGFDELNENKNLELENPVKIALLGEIYMLLEKRANMGIEKYLGNLGAVVKRNVYLGNWVREHLNPLPFRKKNPAVHAAKPYLDHFVGGHGRESVGDAVIKAKENYDGIVHILPFTCAPEIIAQSLLPKVSKDYNIPILTLSLDEHTGRLGLHTRLEAFYDLLSRRERATLEV
ncbi:acyl-CoA dehydratase activase-related protein [Natranaerofaba carboxydovora]|uniref:acyl-CoA dehydratase activase-related protein n=1 Tax=Natranaerofaba carboxydovora TaxID=2742683 RepID=UPI001F134964|nr:acyl-CoA dehydratase activase-related protein [Natranaerofaba carboxydovora]UMZ73911.1 hypothetical protein ACONDI_01481 [Natranaerofaba carboxydovora]